MANMSAHRIFQGKMRTGWWDENRDPAYRRAVKKAVRAIVRDDITDQLDDNQDESEIVNAVRSWLNAK